jgi:peptidoglycan-associated lipoprotein
MIHRLLAVLLLIASAYSSYSQRYVTVADEALAAEEYHKAIDLYKNAYSQLTEGPELKAQIAYNIGYCYRRLAMPDHARLWLQKSIELLYRQPLVHLYYADALRMEELYEDAEEQYNIYKSRATDDPRADRGLVSCRLAQRWTNSPTRYKVTNLPYLNSTFSDYAPMLSNKEETQIIFTSSREGASGTRQHGATGQPFADLYQSERNQDGSWSQALNLGYPLNSDSEEGAVSINSEYSAIIFTRCEYSQKKQSTCKIYVAGRMADYWDKPNQFRVFDDRKDTFLVAHPALTPDGLRLYFVSDKTGGYGGYDIWYIERESREDDWVKEPINAGEPINTPGNEVYPYVRHDSVFFFSSDGHKGMGGLDIYRVNLDERGNQQVLNLMYPINSPMDDFGITYFKNKEKGFFSSNRKGGRGLDDIYQFSLEPLEFSVSGRILDDSNGNPLAGVPVRALGSDGKTITAAADESGRYSMELSPGVNYVLLTSKNGYLVGKGRLSTDGIEESIGFGLDIRMSPINIPVEIPNVMYGAGSWELRHESVVSLEKLYDILIDNPSIIIEISSHTDFRPGRISNDELSQRRAQSVINYLVVKGIDKQRLVPKGYGSAKPQRATDRHVAQHSFLRRGQLLDETYIRSLQPDEQEKAHQINRRTELRVIDTNYSE